MAQATTDNPPAFPVNTTGQLEPSDGMTLRDWFAGQALAGGEIVRYKPEAAARFAYVISGAMLVARLQVSA